MVAYVSESVLSSTIKDLLDKNWDTHTGKIPKPKLVDVNDGSEPIREVNLLRGDFIVIRADSPSEVEEPIGNWTYANRRYEVSLELYTNSGRQRIYDLKAEVRRVCHNQMHSVTGFQRIQYKDFNEFTDEQSQIHEGEIKIELISSASLMEI